MYIPKDIEWHRPLYFDYGASLSTAVALIPLTHDPDAVPAGSISSALPSGPGSQDASGWPHAHSPPFLSSEPPATAPKLLLSPGRRASLSVRLRLPPAKDQDLFQVTGEFLTAEGQLLGRSARTHVPRPRALVPRVVHYALTAPWAAIGLYDDSELVELRLFDAFGVPLLKAPSGASTRKGRRRSASNSGGGPGNGSGDTSGVADAPAQPLAPPAPAYFRARLVGRSPSAGPPKVYSADMHLKLKLGEWLIVGREGVAGGRIGYQEAGMLWCPCCQDVCVSAGMAFLMNQCMSCSMRTIAQNQTCRLHVHVRHVCLSPHPASPHTGHPCRPTCTIP